MATAPAPDDYYHITAEQFLAIQWDSSDVKAELVDGVVRMMSGGTAAHSRVQSNLMIALGMRLRGSGCRPHASDMAVKTAYDKVRYPDVSVFCGKDAPDSDRVQAFDDPKLLVEILSPSTRASDLVEKLGEYRSLTSLEHLLFIDPVEETVRHLVRTGTNSWHDAELDAGSSVDLGSLGGTLTHDDIFTRS
jgi:Uma2 family endonuclease